MQITPSSHIILGKRFNSLGLVALLFLWPVLVPQLIPDLLPQLLDRNFRLEDLANPRLPILLEPLQLRLDLVLPRGARGVDEVDLALGGSELGLEGPEVGLDVVVGEQPGLLARAVEELQVLVARGEVRRGDVGALEGCPERIGVRGRGRGLLGFVAGEVERLQRGLGGDALQLNVHGRREGGRAEGGGGWRGGGGGGGFGGDEGVCGGEGFGGDEGVCGGEGFGGGFLVNVCDGS